MLKNTIETDHVIMITEISDERNEFYIYDKTKNRHIRKPLSYREIKDYESDTSAQVLIMHGLLLQTSNEWRSGK